MKSILKKFVFLLIVLIFLVPIAFTLLFLFAVNTSERLARDMAPPEYPNSVLIEDWVSGGMVSLWDRKLYSTQDSIEEVLTFMEGHLGKFEVAEPFEGEQIRYRWGKCNDGLLASLVDFDLGVHPCTSVGIYVEVKDPETTWIKVWIEWPAP